MVLYLSKELCKYFVVISPIFRLIRIDPALIFLFLKFEGYRSINSLRIDEPVRSDIYV